MSESLRELPADAIVHRLAAPEFSLPYPEIWNEHLIPDNASTSGMRSRWNTGTFGGRPVTLWVLENVFVVGDGLVFDRDLNLYRIPHQVRPPAAIEAALDRLRAARSGLSLEPGLHVLCKDRGAGVYGHWLIDLLPRAYFARKLLQQPFLTIVPQAHGALSTSIADSLALLGFSSSDLVTVDAAPRWFERVVVVDGLSCHGPYMSPLVFEALDALREKVAPQGATRLYVDRPATDHRRFKDAQLIRTLAGEAGFAAIDPGTLPISEQIGRFAAARTIFGVMGSAMANIAFAAPGATVFICAPASMADTFFWFIAGHRKLRYIEIRCSQAPKSGTHEWDAEITLSDADRARIFSTARPGMDAGVSMTQMRTAAEAPGAAGTAGTAYDSGAGHRDGPGAPAITEQYLLDRVWKFYRKNGAVASNRLRFLPNGKISGYTHPNERSWLLDQGCLAFANGEARITTRFDSVTIQDGVTTLCGPYLADPSIILCLSDQTEAFPRNPGTKAALARQIAARGWQIGDHTYGVPSFFDVEDGKLTIGKYTSIAAGVKIALADHRMDTVSTYPFAVLRAYWPSVPLNASDHTSKGPVVIGNDVWIGADAIILSGVSVGSGAVIGAKAVVSQDVPPYAVVVGSPARVVRYRFPDNVIARLLGVAWWDWPDEVVDAHLPLMMSSDIEAFLAAAEAFCATR